MYTNWETLPAPGSRSVAGALRVERRAGAGLRSGAVPRTLLPELVPVARPDARRAAPPPPPRGGNKGGSARGAEPGGKGAERLVVSRFVLARFVPVWGTRWRGGRRPRTLKWECRVLAHLAAWRRGASPARAAEGSAPARPAVFASTEAGCGGAVRCRGPGI